MSASRVLPRVGERSDVHVGAWFVAVFCIVTVVYGAGAQLSWEIFGAANIGLAFFPPAGVTLAALVLLPRRLWLAVIASIWTAELAVDLHHRVSLGKSVGWALANSMEPLVGALVLERIGGRRVDLDRRAGMSRFLIAGVVAGPVVAAVIGGGVKVYRVGGSWWLAAIQWWAGDGLAVLAIGAPILFLRHGYRFESRKRAAEGAFLVAASVVASVLAFWTWNVPPSLLVLPILIVAALRFGTAGVCFVTIVVAVVANIGTAEGRGPFAALDSLSRPNQLAITQLFLASTILTAWFLAIETSERAIAQTREISERVARERAEATQDVGMLSADLVRALTIDQIAGVVDKHARRSLGAAWATVELPDAVVRDAARARSPISEAAQEHRTIVLRSLDDIARTYPGSRERWAASGIGAAVFVPLPQGSNVSGAVCVAFASPQTFDDEQLTLITALVDTAGPALERSVAFDAERRLRESTEALTRLTAALSTLDTLSMVLREAAIGLPHVVAPADLVLVSSAADGALQRVLVGGETAASVDSGGLVPETITSLVTDAIATNRLVVRNGLGEDDDMTRDVAAGEWAMPAGAVAVVPISSSGRRFGAVALTLKSGSFDQTQVQQLQLIGEILSQSLARTERVADEQIRRRFAEVLAEASSRLVSFDGDSMAAVATSIVEGTAAVVGADAGVLFEVDGDRLRLTHSWGYRSEHVAGWGDLALADRTPLADAAREQTIITLVSRRDWLARYPHLAELHEQTNFAVTMAIPLVDAQHGSAMVLGLSFTDVSTLTGTVVAWLPSMANRWVNLLIQARLAAREQAVQHQLAALQRLTAGLAVARTRTDVADAFSASGAGAFGALHVWLGLHDTPSRTLELLGTSWDHLGAEMFQSLASDDDPQPATTVLREGRAMYFGSAEELVARYPHLAAPVAAMGAEALAALPLTWHDEVVGVLAMNYATARTFDDAERRLLRTVADLCAQALERIRLAEHEHHAVIELQHAMLGQPDRIRFAHVGYAYRPADGQLEVGGDWYDIIALPNGRCGLVVGDVVGHDVPAAATMGQLRNATRALAMIIDDPAEVVTQLERFMIDLEPARASTMLYAVFDPLDRSLRYHCAGHLPPLMTTVDGSSYLEDGRGAPLGVLAPARATATTIVPPSARLLLYTDGLIERRHESLDIGMARLVDAVDGLADLDEDALCRALVIEMVDESDVRDDIAVLAVRPMPLSFGERINAHVDEIRPLRHRVRDWLQSIDVASDRIDEIVLSLSEAVTNAVEHAYHRQPLGRIEVEGVVDGDRLELTIRDRGEWRSGPPRRDGGRGVDLMRALSVEMRLETGSDGTTVRVVHDLFEPTLRRGRRGEI